MKLTKASVAKLETRETRYAAYDDDQRGFGVMVQPSGVRSFIFEYRPAGAGRSAAKRRVTLGKVGSISVDDAKRAARDLLADVVKGGDPAADRAAGKKDQAFRIIANRWMDEQITAKRKPRTAADYQAILDKHLTPALGSKKLADITRTDASKLHAAISKASPIMANKAMAILSSLWTWATRENLCAIEANPVRLIERNRETKRERFLSDDELERLGAALDEAETLGLPWVADETKPKAKHLAKPANRRTKIDTRACDAIRMLLLSGCRLREILRLQWSEIDVQRGLLFLGDSKTGARPVVLSGVALALLQRQIPEDGNPYVFPGRNGGCRSDLKKPWAAITKAAGLDGLRIHDLRHSNASVAAGAEVPLQIIGKLLGHSQIATTMRYAHLSNNPVRQAADKVSAHIETAMSRRRKG